LSPTAQCGLWFSASSFWQSLKRLNPLSQLSTVTTLKRPQVALKLFAASFLISVNWLVYIWATNNGHVVEASLGYYINPLIIIAFGVLLLKEKMRVLQWVAVGIASLGVLVLTIDYGRLPWIALALAISWGSYGLIKKQLGLGALEGLAIVQ